MVVVDSFTYSYVDLHMWYGATNGNKNDASRAVRHIEYVTF